MLKQVIREDKKCQICKSSQLRSILKLKATPLEDQFVREEKKSIEQPTYPLELAICEDCGYIRLLHIVSPEASYADYVYESGVTVGLRNHYDEYAKEIVSEYQISPNSLVVDLGSNDGSMLASFKRQGMQVVGVEPAKIIAEKASAAGIMTINDFFTEAVAMQIKNTYSQARVVTANYMYANIDDVISFTKSVSTLLAPDGIFVVQSGYHPEQMKIKMFDYIYHEHFSYFTVAVLKNIFQLCGLELIQVTKTLPKGGSIRVVGQLKTGTRKIDSSVEQLILEENEANIRDIKTYQRFSKEIDDVKNELIGLLREFKNSGKRIAALGASHSTTTLTYHFELAPFIEYIVDDNILKQDSYSPGHHFPVYSTDKLYGDDKPDVVLILAWQHQNSILERHTGFLENGGTFLIPLPNINIITSDGKK